MYSKREPCISLIISPLVSLMDDQVTSIAKFMKAACLHSNQTKIQRQKILELISNGELSVLLVSPEAVVAGERHMGKKKDLIYSWFLIIQCRYLENISLSFTVL